ncbi:response regulator [Ammoniphilus sp. 3BR4]|uniref:response regulator transcription factor n=1 Tax=Ammoniphilus sp. 3BR4 TaxID=3158265 RepID=UPI003465FB6D
MRILIADDESLIRSSLRSMLEEMNLPLQIIGEAANGEQTIQFVKECEPDLVFIDIRMPKINGLEAIKTGKTFSPHTRWVILTGFSDFNYAREAIQLGAADYLLKPVSPEELEQSLQKWMKDKQKYDNGLNRQFENEIIALYHGLGSIHDENDKSIHSHASYICSVFFIDSHLEETAKSEQLLKFSHALRKTIDEFVGNEIRIALFSLPSGELITVGAWGFVKDTAGKKILQQYLEKCTGIVNQFCDKNFSVTAIQGHECLSFGHLEQQVSQILDVSSLRSTLGIGSNWDLNHFTCYEPDSDIMELSRILIKLSDCHKEDNYLNYMKTLSDLEKVIVNMKLVNSIKQHITDFLQRSIDCRLKADEDMKAWIKQLQVHGEKLITENQKSENRQSALVSQVIAYIDQNYMNDIGIGQIAEHLHVTPNYLSTLFHKNTGMTFTKYMTRTRIFKAKELLMDPSIQVQHVAEKVGYYSTRHFTKLFTEWVGCYPSEFRNQMKESL